MKVFPIVIRKTSRDKTKKIYIVSRRWQFAKLYDFSLAAPANRMMIMWESGCFLARSYDCNLGKSMTAIWDATPWPKTSMFNVLCQDLTPFVFCM